MFTLSNQDNQVILLPIAQFVYNNLIYDLIKITPFYIVYSKYPILTLPPKDSRLEGEVLDIIERVKRIYNIRELLIEYLKKV